MALVFITKTQAGQLQSAAVANTINALPQKFNDAIVAAANAGLVTLTFSYFPATSAQADAFIAGTLGPAGWTAVNNNNANPGNFTITVS